jgi:hypothetical protein
MVTLSSAGGFISNFLVDVVFGVFAIVVIVLAYRRWPASARKAAGWPETQGTIQNVRQVIIDAGRGNRTVDVGDFSYKVNEEFYSGRAMISREFSTGDGSPKALVDQKVRVLYDPQKPERFSFSPQQVGGFLLNPYVEVNATDVDPIDLNIA